MSLEKELKKLNIGKIKAKQKLEDFTTYKLQGEIKLVAYPKSVDDLRKLLLFLRTNDIKHMVIGRGSNLIFVNDYYDGVLINLEEFNGIEIDEDTVVSGAGVNLIKLAYKVSRAGLVGLEFAAGIPGTVGGAIYMNAGAYGSDMGYVVDEIVVLDPNLEVKILKNRDLNFHYRTSFLQKNKEYICLEVKFKLVKGSVNILMDIIEDRKQRRLSSQPLEYPSAGSVFRNPENDYAGRLIEELGFKGKNIGDAFVSEKHANFIVNYGKATGKDVKMLIEEITNQVKEKYSVDLKIEQEYIE